MAGIDANHALGVGERVPSQQRALGSHGLAHCVLLPYSARLRAQWRISAKIGGEIPGPVPCERGRDAVPPIATVRSWQSLSPSGPCQQIWASHVL